MAVAIVIIVYESLIIESFFSRYVLAEKSLYIKKNYYLLLLVLVFLKICIEKK